MRRPASRPVPTPVRLAARPGRPARERRLSVSGLFDHALLAYILWNHALRTLKAFELNMLANVTPLATAVMAWFTLHEPLILRRAIGILVVLAGVSLVQWAGR
ncbi:MAG: EamA family transporter [Chloroflexi bacterium]|nr:MAG: EamA family transporter [Chloroflexota bacterium]